MKTHKLYPVEIYEFQFDGDCNKFIDVINSSNLIRRPDTWMQNTCLRLQHEEAWKPVSGFIQSCLDEIYEHFNYDCDGLRITSMWANKYEIGVAQQAHRHANAYLSGNLFLNEGAPIVFFDPIKERNFGQMEIFRKPKITLSGIEQNAPILETIQASPGKLVIFPSWFVHITEPADALRYTVGFNSMPIGSINSDILNIQVV